MLSLSTSRLGVTFFIPIGWGSIIVHFDLLNNTFYRWNDELSFLFYHHNLLNTNGKPSHLQLSRFKSAYLHFTPNRSLDRYGAICYRFGFKREESVASDDLQHSLFVGNRKCAEKCAQRWEIIGLQRRIRITHTRRKGFAEGRFAKCLLFPRNRVGGFGRLRFFGSSRNVACGEKIAVNQRMTAERSRSLLDDGQKLLRHHREGLLLREH